jgi:ADP-heptose:LPS heptosyltransferase
MVSRLMLRARTLTPSKLPRAIEIVLGLGGVSRRAGGAVSDYANVLRQADVELNDNRLLIIPSAEEDSRFERRLASGGSRGGELIALLYASNPEGRHGWPVTSFGEIALRLANNFNVRIVAADEPSDDAFTNAVNPSLPAGAIKLAEPRALELVAAIARASIVVTDERIIALLASELGTPVIEVAGALHAAGSVSINHRVVQASSHARVSTDEVYDVACEMIQESRSSSLFRRP